MYIKPVRKQSYTVLVQPNIDEDGDLQSMVIDSKGRIIVDSYGYIQTLKACPSGVNCVGQKTQTAGIQEAINYVQNLGGGKVFIKSGTYNIYTNLQINQGGISIEGELVGGINYLLGQSNPSTYVGVRIIQNASSTDIIDINIPSATVNLKNLWLFFNQTTTGNGITLMTSNNQWSLVYSEWDNLFVTGTDSNHYSFYLADFIESNFGYLGAISSDGGFLFGCTTNYHNGNSTIRHIRLFPKSSSGSTPNSAITFNGNLTGNGGNVNLITIDMVEMQPPSNTNIQYSNIFMFNSASYITIRQIYQEFFTRAANYDFSFNAFSSSNVINATLFESQGYNVYVGLLSNSAQNNFIDFNGQIGHIYANPNSYPTYGTLKNFNTGSQYLSGSVILQNPSWKFMPITAYTSSLSLPANPPALGTVYQNTNLADIEIYLPVTFSPTSTASATFTVSIGTSSSSLNSMGTWSEPAGSTAGSVLVIPIRIPAGNYFEFTGSNVTLGTATILLV